ncbi:hypothetical protein [Actinacidiphila glaucinigra]|uniref:hypothetical protein n=1 Tax=Actinacidiphila glaucinigra TaxID=235986 RepID=UPI0036EA9A52
MTTMLDRYFEIVDSADGGDSHLDGLRDILAEDVVLMHSGDMVRGLDLAVDLPACRSDLRRSRSVMVARGSRRLWMP